MFANHNLKCLLIGHKYQTTKDLVKGFRKVSCKRCKKEWLVQEDRRRFIPWKYCSEIDNN